MSTLGQLEIELAVVLRDFEGTSEDINVIARYVDARISIAIHKPVPIFAQNVCPCVFRDGKFTSLCAMHQDLVDRSFKLGQNIK